MNNNPTHLWTVLGVGVVLLSCAVGLAILDASGTASVDTVFDVLGKLVGLLGPWLGGGALGAGATLAVQHRAENREGSDPDYGGYKPPS